MMRTYPVKCPECNRNAGYSQSKGSYFDKCPYARKDGCLDTVAKKYQRFNKDIGF